MAANSLIVTVTITKSTRTVTLASFSIPAILGPSNRIGSDPFRVYTDPSAMIMDGFMISDPEYIHAVALRAQPIKPKQFLVSKFTAAVAQVDTFQVGTLTTGHAYAFTLNGTIITYTSSGGDTQQSILAALLTAIGVAFPSSPPVSGAVVGTGPSATLTLTSTVAGVGISYTAIDASLTHVASVVNHSIVNDLITLLAAVGPTTTPYGILVTSKVASDIAQVAGFIETQLLVYVAASADANCLTTATTDVMSVCKNKAYARTMLLYSATATTEAADAAWMGYLLPTTPGSSNWAEKQLQGVTADNLNPTQIANVLGKNGNVYVPVAGAGTTLYGNVCSGDFMDNTIFIDWLSSQIQTNVISLLTDPTNLKIPYTNPGISKVENQVRGAMQQGQDNGGLAPGWTVVSPLVSSVSQADKKARVLNNVIASGTLAGAINQVNVQVFVSV